MNQSIALSLPRRGSLAAALLRFLLLNLAFLALLLAHRANSQYSAVEVTRLSQFPPAAQQGFGYGAPVATDGTWLVYSTSTAVWSQSIKGGPLKRLFAAGALLPGSDAKAKLIYQQIEVDQGIVVFLATDGGGGTDGLFGLYSVKADGSEPAKRVADSTLAGQTANWYDFMQPVATYGFFQVNNGVVVFELEGGTLWAANVDGSNLRSIWQVEPSGFKGCSSGGEYSNVFLVTQAFQPATDGKNYAFGAGNFLSFDAVYQGPLTTSNACGDLIDSGDSINDPALKILPGQPQAGAAFAFPQGESFQIDGGYVYFAAYSANGVKAGEDYYGYFKVPLKGGKASVVVSNISHIPGIVGSHGAYVQAKLLGFAVRNGRFIFAAQDTTQNDPESFYMVQGASYTRLFASGTSVSNRCIGGLDSGFNGEIEINQHSLTSDGKLVFYAYDAPPTFPNAIGPCSYPIFDYIHLPYAYFVLDTTHRLMPTETEISLNVVPPILYGEKPSLKIKVMPAAGAANPKNLVPTGTVSVWYTNPEYFGQLQPKPGSAKLNADGEATMALGAQQIGTYSYVVAYGGDTNFASSGSAKLTFPLHVTAPKFSIPGATYKTAQSVSMTDATPGSTIHYTLNGTIPTKSSPTFLNAIPISKTTTVNAIAIAVGDLPSSVTTATYTIK